jgi:hypothetical protein
MNRTRTFPRLAMPDYSRRCHQRGPEALIEAFLAYGLVPDDRGEIRHLSPSHAALIRSCGYPARAGQTWRCPLLPDELVRGYPFFEHLTNAERWSRRWGRGPFDWHLKRAALRAIAPLDPISGHEQSILKLLAKQPGQRPTRRQIQQRVSRRFPTRYLDCMLGRLLALDRITVEGDGIYPFGRAELEARHRRGRDLNRKLVSVVFPDGSRSTVW